ncbi:MAG: MobF family relaxase [Solirubrobacterales bacterium]
MVGVTKIQRGNAGYWLAAVAEGGDDYYTKPGEAPGEWIGELAAELGLSGEVDAESYSAILEGRDPTRGEQLVRRPETRYRPRPDGSEKRVEPVLGYDVRFSAPKSVSILYALGDEATRTRLLSVLNDAVRQGLAHLEHEACFVQRGKGGHRIERGEGFVGMAFRHRMSRAKDPALHVHVVISNLTRATSDGKWLSLASPRGRSPLWPHGKSAGVVFQAALRAGFLREFGLDFEAVTNGYADLKGFDRDVIDAFSTRSKEIASWLEKHGVSTVEAAQTAAYRTREAKDYGVNEDDRREEWIATAEPYGITPEGMSEMVTGARPREPRKVSAEDLDAALAKLEETCSHFDRRALLWALCDQLPEGADGPTLTAAVDQVLASERIVCVHESTGPLDFDHYTTPRLAEMESRFMDGALRGVDAGVAQVPRDIVDAVLAEHPYLGADQQAMVIRLATSGERVVPIAALPGTGKTVALDTARGAFEAAGYDVRGCAMACTASGELKDAGIHNAISIRALLNQAERLQAQGVMPFRRETVIFVDEASPVSTPDLEALRLVALECDAKLALIGDPHQIGAIGPGGLYAHLTRTVDTTTLDTIRRQRRPEDQQLVQLVHEGRGSEALDLLRTQDRLVVGDDLQTVLSGQLADWHRDYSTGADAVMIARRNRDVDYLNDQARELRREEGALGSAEVIVGERPFAAGDRVQTRANKEGVCNRERWDVLDVDAAARTIELRRVGGDERTVTLGPKFLNRRREDNGPALEYAYALTKFGAQGKTVDRAYPLLDAGASLEQELVAVSRGGEVANVYAVASSELIDPELGPGRREVSDDLHDIRSAMEREGNDFAAAEVDLRKQIERLTPRELADRRAELAAAGRAVDPLLSRRDRLEREIKDAEFWVAALSRERAAIEAMKDPPAEELARVMRAEAALVERLSRNRGERDALPESTAMGEPKPVDPALRLKAALVDRRINQLARRDVEAARLEPSKAIYEALGPYPHDPDKALAWHKGAHAIATYRRRHGIREESNALGKQPRSAAARAERARAQRRLQEAQRQLGRAADRSAQRVASRAPTIGR